MSDELAKALAEAQILATELEVERAARRDLEKILGSLPGREQGAGSGEQGAGMLEVLPRFVRLNERTWVNVDRIEAVELMEYGYPEAKVRTARFDYAVTGEALARLMELVGNTGRQDAGGPRL